MRAVSQTRVTGDRLSRWLALCGVGAPLAMAAFVTVAGLMAPGYSHISETISQLGAAGRPHPQVMNSGFIIYGLLINGFAYGLYRRLGRGSGAKAVWLLLALHGLGVLLSGVFHDDPRSQEPATLGSALHSAFASLAFAALIVAMAVLARSMRHNPAWQGIAFISMAIAALNLVISPLFLLEAFEPIEGALQRAFIGTSVVWVELVSWRSFRLSRETARVRQQPG